jgi:hypothetical protein
MQLGVLLSVDRGSCSDTRASHTPLIPYYLWNIFLAGHSIGVDRSPLQ